MTDLAADAGTTHAEATATEGALSAWDRVRIARHPERPHALAYIHGLMSEFVELHGDRAFGDDRALIGGLANFRGRTVMALGHQKGENTRENIERNFGMARPEGYRKAERLLRHAGKFGFPVVTFIDTPGAEPNIASEERGQATAIAESLIMMANLRVPSVAVVIGEGGSGGALAIGVADRIVMLENAIYAVASPEACAAILWKDAAKAADAAETMRITARELAGLGIVDAIVPEPTPAHEAANATIQATGETIARLLDELLATHSIADQPGVERLREARYRKFRRIGAWRQEEQRAHNLPDDDLAL